MKVRFCATEHDLSTGGSVWERQLQVDLGSYRVELVLHQLFVGNILQNALWGRRDAARQRLRLVRK